MNPTITDHAVVRYIERIHKIDIINLLGREVSDASKLRYLQRVHKVDISKIREMMVPCDFEKTINKFSDSTIKLVFKNYKLVVVNKTVVTVTIAEKEKRLKVNRRPDVLRVCKFSL